MKPTQFQNRTIATRKDIIAGAAGLLAAAAVSAPAFAAALAAWELFFSHTPYQFGCM
jgi:hypothetical protein